MLSLTNEPEKLYFPYTNYSINWGKPPKEFIAMLDSADFGSVAVGLGLTTHPSFQQLLEAVEKKKRSLQRDRKSANDLIEKRNRATVEVWLKQPENAHLASLYDNIRKCETTPFNQP